MWLSEVQARHPSPRVHQLPQGSGLEIFAPKCVVWLLSPSHRSCIELLTIALWADCGGMSTSVRTPTQFAVRSVV